MTGWQVLSKVEAPCALPLFLSGLRSATLQVIATATIAASVSLGGLGRYLIDGLASRDYVQMVCGSILVALLALVADGAPGPAREMGGLTGNLRPGHRVLLVHALETPIPTPNHNLRRR